MKTKVLLGYFLFVPAALLSNMASADSSMITAKYLLESCSSNNVTNNNICAGYIAGLIDTLVVLQAQDIIERVICVPGNMEMTTLVKGVSKYLDQHPEELGLNASSVILDPLMTELPCEQ